jgi:putative membrane protein
MHWMNGGGWFMGGMWVFWIFLLVVLVLVVRWAATGFRQGDSGVTRGDGSRAVETPEDVLKKRYARGEISREEFQSKLRDVRA